MSAISVAGILAILLGLIFWYFGSRSRGEMEIELGKFKGPIGFLFIIFGLFLIVLDAVISRV